MEVKLNIIIILLLFGCCCEAEKIQPYQATPVTAAIYVKCSPIIILFIFSKLNKFDKCLILLIILNIQRLQYIK